jgi:acetyl-CoA acetyltransferase
MRIAATRSGRAGRYWAEAQSLAPVARLVSYGIAAVEPGMFGLGPIPAVRQALDRAGWRLGDVERVEINEAFAAIVIAVTRELGLSPDIVNVEGGAIAHRHPIGAAGAVLTTQPHPFDASRRPQPRDCHHVHRRRPGHGAGHRSAALKTRR